MKLNNVFFPFLLLLFLSCKTTFTPVSHTEKLYSVNGSSLSDTISSIESFLKPYRDSLSKSMNEVIGFADGDFHKEKSGGSLGNLITDAMSEEAIKLQLTCCAALFNPGGIRLPDVMKGSITKGKLLELIPFDNELVIVALKGSVLKQWLTAIGGAGGWPVKFEVGLGTNNNQSSFICTYKKVMLTTPESVNANVKMLDSNQPSPNIRMMFDHKVLVASYSDTVYVEQVDGSLLMEITQFYIDNEATYHIATNDYVANGGDNCGFLKEQKRINTGRLIRDIVGIYIRQRQNIKPDETNRIEFK
jgi:2',3'-cyclic-nucleotide 2'-phosphodiesterase (5'-nucleotidase family)